MNAIPLAAVNPREGVRRPARPWRFMRLVRGQTQPSQPAAKAPVRNTGHRAEVYALRGLPREDPNSGWPGGSSRTLRSISNHRSGNGDVCLSTPRPTRHRYLSTFAVHALAAIVFTSYCERWLFGRPNRARRSTMGRLDRWIEHVKEGWRARRFWRDRWIRPSFDGNRVEDQVTGYVLGSPLFGQLLMFEADLAGEKVEIPSGLVAGPPPPTSDFFFSDLPYDTQV